MHNYFSTYRNQELFRGCQIWKTHFAHQHTKIAVIVTQADFFRIKCPVDLCSYVYPPTPHSLHMKHNGLCTALFQA